VSHVPVTSETTHEFYEPWYDHPVVFMGMKLGVTLKQEYRLTVHENRVLRRIVRRKRDDTVRGWRKLDNEEIHKVYFSIYI
jgi:hypothetical protein